ncbi:MAG: hypothetical protein RIR04_2112 [Pseudomonadota bacterium]|jgi:hypothetical protein
MNKLKYAENIDLCAKEGWESPFCREKIDRFMKIVKTLKILTNYIDQKETEIQDFL